MSPPPETLADDEINLLDYWRVLVKRKKLLARIVGAAILGAILISLILPKIYAASTSLLPPQESSGAGSLISSQLPGGLGGLVGGALGLKSPIDLWVGILKSRTVFGKIVSEFNLKAVYEVSSDEAAIKALRSAVNIKKSKEQILSITVEDRDPERAAELANAFVKALDRINRGITTTSGGRMRAFVEGRLNEAKLALLKSEEALKDFQEENGAVQLDAQSSAIIGAIGEVNGHLLAKEVACSYCRRRYLGFDSHQSYPAENLRCQYQFTSPTRELGCREFNFFTASGRTRRTCRRCFRSEITH